MVPHRSGFVKALDKRAGVEYDRVEKMFTVFAIYRRDMVMQT